MYDFYQHFPEIPEILSTILHPPDYLRHNDNPLRMLLYFYQNQDDCSLVVSRNNNVFLLEKPSGETHEGVCVEILSMICEFYKEYPDLSVWVIDNESDGYEFDFKSSRHDRLPEWRAFIGLLEPIYHQPINSKKRKQDETF